MARLLTFTKSNTAKRGIRKKTISDKLRVGSVTLGFITVTLICLLSLFYLSGVNSLATKGYDIKFYEERLNELKKENQRLKTEAAELQSMRRLKDSVEKLNMVSVRNVSYISGSGSVVASK